MLEVVNCPLCGKEPEVWCRDEEWRIRITCCRHVVYSTDAWNRYAAAMELAQLEVEFENCKAEDEHKYQEMIEWARNDVLRVFK